MKPLIIGIAGGTGSGKTTVARSIEECIGKQHVALISHDSYYRNLSLEEKFHIDEVNFDHPDAFDTTLLVEHLQQLKTNNSITVPHYDFARHERSGVGTVVEPRKVIIVEGILLFTDERLQSLFDVKIFVDTDADERLMRRITRDISYRGRTLESVLHQYQSTVKPMHTRFVEPSKRKADVIIPFGGQNAVAIEMVVSRINMRLLSDNEGRALDSFAPANVVHYHGVLSSLIRSEPTGL